MPSQSKCSRCKTTFYCGSEHQRSDWKAHKKTCVFAPYATQVQGILLSTIDSPPNLVSVKCDVRCFDPSDPTEEGIFRPDFKTYLGDADYGRIVVRNMGGPSDRPLKHWLTVFMRDNFLNDGSPANKSVASLIGGPPPHNWCGNLLVLKSASAGKDDGRYQDANLGEDIQTLKSWLRWYCRDTQPPLDFSNLPFKPTHVVNL
ncbi:hypothetical protein OF83DRAFT_1174440 [Amylostereum chailletii]|nr:hypothetical protein OF83DRAFT_1174440 [Amylostereum chailletii]